MEWFLVGAAFLFLFLVLLLIPWSVDLYLSAEHGFTWKLKLGGLIPVMRGRRRWGHAAGAAAPKTPQGGITADSLADALRMVRIDTAVNLIRYFRALAGHTKLKMEISGEIGLGDPALTGAAYGLICSLAGARGVRTVHITPNFMDLVIRGEIKLAGSFIPLVVFSRTIRTVLHPSMMKVLLALAGSGRAENTEEVYSVGS